MLSATATATIYFDATRPASASSRRRSDVEFFGVKFFCYSPGPGKPSAFRPRGEDLEGRACSDNLDTSRSLGGFRAQGIGGHSRRKHLVHDMDLTS